MFLIVLIFVLCLPKLSWTYQYYNGMHTVSHLPRIVKTKLKALNSDMSSAVAISVCSAGVVACVPLLALPLVAGWELGYYNGGMKLSARSVRNVEMEKMREFLKSDTNKQAYFVVEGPKGVGKSCLIDTALEFVKGVVRVDIPPGMLQTDVEERCLRAVAGYACKIFQPRWAAKQIVSWYRCLHRASPVLVMSLSERPKNKEFAEITGAVRKLAAMGIKVVVDASPNSVTPELLSTLREEVMHVEEMSTENIRALPDLQQLFKVLDTAGLSKVVTDLLGGIPANFISLSRHVIGKDNDVPTVVKKFLQTKIIDAMSETRIMRIREPKFTKVFELLRDEASGVNPDVLIELGLELPSPCKVLRIRSGLEGRKSSLVPSTPVAAFVLRHNCDEGEALDALHELVQKAK
jgi:hypothetical protein